MLRIGKNICYTDEPPENYATWENGIPTSPFLAVVDRATGCHFIRSKGHNIDNLQHGLPVWNAFAMVYPQIDCVPDLLRDGSPASLEQLANLPLPTVAMYGELFAFASICGEWLLQPPTRFVRNLKSVGAEIPSMWGTSIDSLTKRALRLESVDLDSNILNVIFRKG